MFPLNRSFDISVHGAVKLHMKSVKQAMLLREWWHQCSKGFLNTSVALIFRQMQRYQMFESFDICVHSAERLHMKSVKQAMLLREWWHQCSKVFLST